MFGCPRTIYVGMYIIANLFKGRKHNYKYYNIIDSEKHKLIFFYLAILNLRGLFQMILFYESDPSIERMVLLKTADRSILMNSQTSCG